MVKIKFCGFTNSADVINASSLKIDFIGFNFYQGSKRYIEPQRAKNIIKIIPSTINPVGIFVNSPVENILKVSKLCEFKYIQLHGEEDSNFCKKIKSLKKDFIIIKYFKAIRKEIIKIKNFINVIDYVLIDTPLYSMRGGSGKTYNWEIALEAKKFDIPIFLAGGLNPQNVRFAINMVSPFAVDCASGIEHYPGIKDLQKMRDFVNEVNSYLTFN